MTQKISSVVSGLLVAGLLSSATPARAQDTPWSMDVAIGWDNSISGDFLTGTIGSLQSLPLVLDKQKWDDVYGIGTLFNISVGYAWNDRTELRGGFTYQSTGADDTVTIGTYRGGPLSARFDNYRSWGLDAGYRRYFAEAAERWRPYAGGSVGFGSVRAIRVDLAQTNANFVLEDVEFYEGNAAVTLGANGGVLYRLTDRVSLDARIALRYVSGLSDVDDPAFGGLDDANDGSSRWTLPLTVGAKFRF